MDINEKSFKKRWAVIKHGDKDIMGVLYHYDASKYESVSIHVYETNQTFTGEIHNVLDSLTKVVKKLFKEKYLDKTGLSNLKIVTTQAYQADTNSLMFNKQLTQKRV